MFQLFFFAFLFLFNFLWDLLGYIHNSWLGLVFFYIQIGCIVAYCCMCVCVSVVESVNARLSFYLLRPAAIHLMYWQRMQSKCTDRLIHIFFSSRIKYSLLNLHCITLYTLSSAKIKLFIQVRKIKFDC